MPLRGRLAEYSAAVHGIIAPFLGSGVSWMYGSALLFLPLLQQDSDAQRTTLGNPGGNDAVGFGFSTIESRRQTRLLDTAVSGGHLPKPPWFLSGLSVLSYLLALAISRFLDPILAGATNIHYRWLYWLFRKSRRMCPLPHPNGCKTSHTQMKTPVNTLVSDRTPRCGPPNTHIHGHSNDKSSEGVLLIIISTVLVVSIFFPLSQYNPKSDSRVFACRYRACNFGANCLEV